LVGLAKEGDDGSSHELGWAEDFVFSDLYTAGLILQDGDVFLLVDVHANMRALSGRDVVACDDALDVSEDIRLFVLVLEQGADNDSHSQGVQIEDVINILGFLSPAELSSLFEMGFQSFESLVIHGAVLLHDAAFLLRFAHR